MPPTTANGRACLRVAAAKVETIRSHIRRQHYWMEAKINWLGIANIDDQIVAGLDKTLDFTVAIQGQLQWGALSLLRQSKEPFSRNPLKDLLGIEPDFRLVNVDARQAIATAD
ncbi:hypothetical protein [Sedimentitalea todarodis]|uniref:Uncharacterized protein n=1 Tax=Sedimentitalea todarodis TaxID=1631240 RepID=A0ABU3VK56_9RHOB|nr:hypothetical protein [Sedimentitalea todarodis]MDU9006578.1 hypothetical protein [Sedimentitalea todarodis]